MAALRFGTHDAPAYQAIGDARRGAYYYTAVDGDGACVAGPELLADLASMQTRVAAPTAWPVVAMETLPPGLPVEIPVALPEAGLLLAGPVSGLWQPPLEPIYLRPVTVTLPKNHP